VAELGNPTGRILLSLRRMSTVKIRVRSLFRTPPSRGGAVGAGNKGLGTASTGKAARNLRPQRVFSPSSTAPIKPSQVVHKRLALRACGKPAFGCKVRGVPSREGSR
jgi:hypothetical protein